MMNSSEYSQLVNCSQQIIRSFIVTVSNMKKGVTIPCLITMGPVMDCEGYVFQVSVSFTPLKVVSPAPEQRPQSAGRQSVTLEKIISSVCLRFDFDEVKWNVPKILQRYLYSRRIR